MLVSVACNSRSVITQGADASLYYSLYLQIMLGDILGMAEQAGPHSLTFYTYHYCGELCVKTLQEWKGRDGKA